MRFKLFLKSMLLLGLLLLALISEATTDKYRIMWHDDPTTTMVIGWNQVSGSNPVVHYGTTDEGTNASAYDSAKAPDSTIPMSTSGVLTNTFARLSGLEPNTAYYFVIKDSEGTSQRFWFKTAPDVNTERLSFIAGGDSRNHRQARVNANKLVAKLRPHAVLFGGDYTEFSTLSEWVNWLDDWQYTIGADGRIIPIVVTRGNHEYLGDLTYYFDAPNDDVYYALTFGGNLIRTYTLNTEITISGDQTDWLANDLAASNDIIWRTAQYHKGMRPHVSWKSEGTSQYNSWAPLFEQYGVQLVIECDAHTVKTTWPIVPSYGTGSEEGFIRDNCKGTVYVGEGCWGAPLRENDDDKGWTRAHGMFNQFKWIFVDQQEIQVRTIKVDNADVVGQVSDNDIFTAPANLDIWNPTFGSVVTVRGAGALCDDNDPCTINDVLDTNCNCVGTFQDTDGDGVCDANDQCPGTNDVIIGMGCYDGDACTVGETFDSQCNCSGGIFQDADGDGVCDANDQCPGDDDSMIGMACDDGDVCTVGETFDSQCNCSGGTFQDADNDGVCDANDQCPGSDDTVDDDNNGIPDCKDTCPVDLVIDNDDVPGSYEASNSIETDQNSNVTVNSTEELILNAGAYIELNQGFDTQPGAYLDAYIEGCTPTNPKLTSTDLTSVRHYPNPFTDRVTLELNLNKDTEIRITIIDIRGRIIHQTSAQDMLSGIHHVHLNTQNWIPGTYFYQVFIKENNTGMTKHANGTLVKI